MGESAAAGVQALKGVEQAVEDFNAAGGILGEKIVLEFQDDAGEPKQAVSVGNVLIALTASGATALRQARPLIEEAHATFFGPHEGVADDLRSTLRDLAALHASQRLL